MDLSDFSEGTKASASYERQRRRITGDNDGEDDDDDGRPAGITTQTGARVYATGITAKRSDAMGGVGTLFIIPTISAPPRPYFLSRSNKKCLLARRWRSSSFRVSVVSFLEARPYFAFLTVSLIFPKIDES